jgi:hypothetical protein
MSKSMPSVPEILKDLQSKPSSIWDVSSVGSQLSSSWKAHFDQPASLSCFSTHDDVSLEFITTFFPNGMNRTNLLASEIASIGKAIYADYPSKMNKHGLPIDPARSDSFKANSSVCHDFEFDMNTGQLSFNQLDVYEPPEKVVQFKLHKPGTAPWIIKHPFDLLRGFFLRTVPSYMYNSVLYLNMRNQAGDYERQLKMEHFRQQIKLCLPLMKMKSIAFGGDIPHVTTEPEFSVCLCNSRDEQFCNGHICQKC